MKKETAISALAALAQDTRLDIFRYLMEVGPEGAAAGKQESRAGTGEDQYDFRLLATSRTSTMQKELQEAGDNGYEYCGQTVFKTALGGNEVVVILERDRDNETVPYYEYRLLATKKTSTMQKELNEAGMEGFMLVGLTVSKTSFGGSEVVSILKRRGKQ